MFNKLLSFILFVGINSCIAQNVLKYDYIISFEFPGNVSTVTIDCNLILGSKSSIFSKDIVKNGKFKNNYNDTDKVAEQKVQSENKYIAGDSIGYVIIKDFQKDNMYRRFLNSENKYVKVEQKIKLFDYNILDEFKNILGYKCQKATTTFDDRNYELWFTNEINSSDGPWIFCGLPGLILEAKTVNGNHQYIVTSLKKDSNIVDLKLDFPHTSLTDMDSYKKDFVDSRIKRYKYNKSKNGAPNGSTSFKIDNLDFPLIIVE